MDSTSRRDKLDENTVRTTQNRIIETCKHIDVPFVEIEVSSLVKNLNYIFNCNYLKEDIVYVLGLIYEKEFYFKGELESDIRY